MLGCDCAKAIFVGTTSVGEFTTAMSLPSEQRRLLYEEETVSN
jgi:hypothetical protein